MFKLKNVSKSFGQKKILTDVNYEFNANKLAFVGLNGVGKSTTMNLILGLDNQFSGHIERNWKSVSVQFSNNSLPDYLSISEFCRARKIDMNLLLKYAKKINVDQYLNTQIRFLSFGTKIKMNILYALSKESEMVFLDEPTNGLDYQTIYNIIEIIKEDPRKFFIISHDLNFIESICDKMVVLNNTKIEFNEKIGDGNSLNKDIKEILNNIIKENNNADLD